MTASAPAAAAAFASSTEPHEWIQMPSLCRRGLPQNVTTASADLAASQWARRANGSSRFTASGPASPALRCASIPTRSRGGGTMPSCPIPPARPIAIVSAEVETATQARADHRNFQSETFAHAHPADSRPAADPYLPA